MKPDELMNVPVIGHNLCMKCYRLSKKAWIVAEREIRDGYGGKKPSTEGGE